MIDQLGLNLNHFGRSRFAKKLSRNIELVFKGFIK